MSKEKKKIKLSDYTGHAIFAIDDISKVYIYYENRKPSLLKVQKKDGDHTFSFSSSEATQGNINVLYYNILKALQVAQENQKNCLDFLVIYGTQANLLSEVEIVE